MHLWEAQVVRRVLDMTAEAQQLSISRDRKDVPGEIFPDIWDLSIQLWTGTTNVQLLDFTCCLSDPSPLPLRPQQTSRFAWQAIWTILLKGFINGLILTYGGVALGYQIAGGMFLQMS